MNEYTFLILDGIPVTIWRNGTVDIHVPDTKSSSTVFGLGWESYQSFKGKLIGTWHTFTATNPKVGQSVRLFNNDEKHPSLPVIVRAVYYDGSPMSITSIWKMVEAHPEIIGNNQGFTSLSEKAKYSVTIARFLKLCFEQKSDRAAEKSLITASSGDSQTSDINRIIEQLISAKIIYRDNGDLVPDTALYHILKQAINRLYTTRPKPFSNTD